MVVAIALIGVSFMASAVLTGFLRKHGEKHRIMDFPNARSSHAVPTPRGGGLSIVVTFGVAVLLLAVSRRLAAGTAAALLGGGGLVAIVGLLDDRRPLRASIRILVHFVAAGWSLWCLGGVPDLDLGWISWKWGWTGQMVVLIGLVWLVNLYNFMDGIDGLAATEAICAGGFGGLLLAAGGVTSLAWPAVGLAGSCAGFLIWNWPPARIFMGDVGSGFLGFAFGVLIIASAKQGSWRVWPWLILLSVFVVDATVTLFRRVWTGAPWYQAHRSHAYQDAARRWGSHLKVTLAVAGVNSVWLLPLAWAASAWPQLAPLLSVVAVAPLIWLAFRFHAGEVSEEQPAPPRSTSGSGSFG